MIRNAILPYELLRISNLFSAQTRHRNTLLANYISFVETNLPARQSGFQQIYLCDVAGSVRSAMISADRRSTV
jgi:hypothetical protein